MSAFPYPKENSAIYETYEWDSVWLDHADGLTEAVPTG